MINYKENYNKWLEDNFFDEETREELSNLIDEKEIEDRFYRDLEFGTGGLRGVMGAGTNRMNQGHCVFSCLSYYGKSIL